MMKIFERTQHLGAAMLAFLVGAASLAAPAQAQDADDAAAGKSVFNRCQSCHQLGETARNVVGPQLNGIVGAKAGTVKDYNYSAAFKKVDIVWDEPALRDFLKKPQAKVAGTKMVFPGISVDRDITNVIAYLKQYGANGKIAQ